ncbi:MAG TPA: UDP-N-acetylmuramate dehydrogenase [Candidatus Onthocola stercoravium]|nr:UDP-N-acetylmuramate dehydrogenase [Candidatus Onthocola stercoravium]
MKEYGEILENVDLKKYNTYGIGGCAKYVIYPSSIANLQKLLKYLADKNISWYVLGGGSNVILPDQDFSGAIIKLDKLDKYTVDRDKVIVEAGISLAKFVKNMLDDGYTNYGSLMGIPGLLGGAIRGNAGAYGINIFDYLISVTIMDELGNIRKLKKDDIKYDYRETEFKKQNIIIIEAEFQGVKGDVALELDNIIKNAKKRKNTQPLEYKNAGSVFKNPPGLSAGYMIEHAGLKGITIGGAQVSEKHANFIINYNNATSHDIIGLIELIKKEVKNKYKVELVLEQQQIIW